MSIDIGDIIKTLISAFTSLIVAFGTWHIQMKKDRKEQTEEVKGILDKHREEYLSGIQEVKDEVVSIKSTVQLNQAMTNEKIDTLSDRVERHNQVIDRTYALERLTAVHEEQIHHLEAAVGHAQ